MPREDDRPMRETELVLPPGVFAFVLDSTKGNINTYCGPIKQSLSNTDQLVVYNADSRRFQPAANFSQAIQTHITAAKGHYVILQNPSRDGHHPEPGKAEMLPPNFLKTGETENLPGPQSFPLWPTQTAEVVLGHQLRSNQYLLVRVYDEEGARTNWNQGVIKLAETAGVGNAPATSVLGIDPTGLFTGQLLIIMGNKVSFYIPPSGIEVLPESGGTEPRYVRDAVTLERLEYCILLDESGLKRYLIGPEVVFPKPTEQFVIRDGKRKYRAYELTDISGLHIKVIADYQEPDGAWHKAGDELFITGASQSIYYPRSEHAIISYGDRELYYAIAIPSGEARYLMNRRTGDIRLVRGPAVYLPNPIDEVVVKRILSDSECGMYFPGNGAVLDYNRSLRTRGAGGAAPLEMPPDGPRPPPLPAAPAVALRELAGPGAFGDTLQRVATYTPPRTITLDTKFEGAVTIDVWSGYAVQVVNRQGERRVVTGPQTVLLAYDEILEPLALSMGTPKDPARTLKTVYLRVRSNAVSDRVSVKTRDLVPLTVQLKYLVRFDGDQASWFNIDNYIQYLCDHLRSLIGNQVRAIGVLEFYFSAATLLRDLVLGAKAQDGSRPLRHFAENGMTVYDLEVISISIDDDRIDQLLHQSQQENLLNTIELERQQRLHLLTAGQEQAKRQIEQERATTQALTQRLLLDIGEGQDRLAMAEIQSQTEREQQRANGTLEVQAIDSRIAAMRLAERQAQLESEAHFAHLALEQRLRERDAQARHLTEQMAAVQPALVEALTAIAATGTLQSLAEHLAPLSLVRDQSLAATLEQMFRGTPLAGLLDNLRQLGQGRLLQGEDPADAS